MRAMTLVLIAGTIGSSVVIALYALYWRANVAVQEMATQEIAHAPRLAGIGGR